jgi:hypothetical protein
MSGVRQLRVHSTSAQPGAPSPGFVMGLRTTPTGSPASQVSGGVAKSPDESTNSREPELDGATSDCCDGVPTVENTQEKVGVDLITVPSVCRKGRQSVSGIRRQPLRNSLIHRQTPIQTAPGILRHACQLGFGGQYSIQLSYGRAVGYCSRAGCSRLRPGADGVVALTRAVYNAREPTCGALWIRSRQSCASS